MLFILRWSETTTMFSVVIDFVIMGSLHCIVNITVLEAIYRSENCIPLNTVGKTLIESAYRSTK